MTHPWKPAHYPSLAPYLAVDGAQRVIDFLRTAFDAVELRRHDAPNGKVMHAELRIDDTVVMLMDGVGDWPAFPVWLHLYVPDVDAAYQRALAAGGTSVQVPVQKGDPDKRGGVKDPSGNTWWIATQIDRS